MVVGGVVVVAGVVVVVGGVVVVVARVVAGVVVVVAGVVAAVSDLHWGIRSVASIALGLVWVRLFIIYHDVQHNAMFKGSTTARFVMALFGQIGRASGRERV